MSGQSGRCQRLSIIPALIGGGEPRVMGFRYLHGCHMPNFYGVDRLSRQGVREREKGQRGNGVYVYIYIYMNIHTYIPRATSTEFIGFQRYSLGEPLHLRKFQEPPNLR